MTNSVVEKVQKHWIWFAVIVLGSTIGVTWKVAHELFVKPRDDEIQRLSRRIAELEKIEGILRVSKDKRVIEKEPTSSLESRATGSGPRDKLINDVIPYSKAYDKLFQKGIPYPKAHDKIKVGMRLTVMKTVHPSAEYDPGWSTWRVDFSSGVFKFVHYITSLLEDSADPEITSMEYYFTDEEARKFITDQALQAFGSDSVKSTMLGEKLEWSDIGGIRVTIDPARYILSEARDERDVPKIPP